MENALLIFYQKASKVFRNFSLNTTSITKIRNTALTLKKKIKAERND